MLELERPIYALDFLALQFDLYFLTKNKLDTKKYELKNLSDYIETQDFCKVYAAWSEGALHFQFLSDKGFATGDKIHLGIDTRDLKSANLIHRFCHLFELTVQEKMVTFFENTHFRRVDDSHELCDSTLLKAIREKGLRKESIYIEIGQNCLTGFDPLRFERLGFFLCS